MIKVNLLATNPGAPAPRVWFPPEQRSALAGLAMLLVTASMVGGVWFYQYKQGAVVNTRTSVIQAELARLKVEAKLVDEMLTKKEQLTERLDLIERLRIEKHAPVSLLETLSRSIPDGLWLVEIRQLGANVQIDGRAMTTTAVTDFAKHLQESGIFLRPVDVLTVSEQVEDSQLVRFTMKAEAFSAAKPEFDKSESKPAGKSGAKPGSKSAATAAVQPSPGA